MNLTEKTIDELIAVSFAKFSDPREKYYFRESMRNLVRLAKAEKMREIRMDATRAMAPATGKISLFAAPES
ncbi:MAG: hypothetical protein C4516_02835 [Oxalobacter sp.]|nr:MAG: hypothetical protein C4516_02835 [Oxalobacter sp.]